MRDARRRGDPNGRPPGPRGRRRSRRAAPDHGARRHMGDAGRGYQRRPRLATTAPRSGRLRFGSGRSPATANDCKMVGVALVVGLEPHVLGAHNPGMVKDPFTADETIALLRRFDAEENSRSQSVYGACGLPGAPYRPWRRPHPRRRRGDRPVGTVAVWPDRGKPSQRSRLRLGISWISAATCSSR